MAGRLGVNEFPSCHGGLENLDQEFDYMIDSVEGGVPNDLKGTFFRNGPGRQRIGDTKYGHWFDGDGMISAFTFKGGQVHFKNKYVRTPKYLDETAAQAICHRGFGTQIPGGLRKNLFKMPANPANEYQHYPSWWPLACPERSWEALGARAGNTGYYR